MKNMNGFLRLLAFTVFCTILLTTNAYAADSYADVVLDYYDSGAGPMEGPYGAIGQTWPVPVSTDVVLGYSPGTSLALPTGTYITVGFVDETIIDGPGDDLYIIEADAGGEEADVYVSYNQVDFVYIGRARDDTTTSFDLSTIGFTNPVTAVKIIGLDNGGSSPGFDVVGVRALAGSIGGASPVPERLLSPIYTKFNTFLKQWNFLELIDAGSAAMTVNVTVFNLFGEVMAQQSQTLNPSSEVDLDINTIVKNACESGNVSSCAQFEDIDQNGLVDTYGLVKLEFDDSDADKLLRGRLSNYRQNSDGNSFSFAFAREFRNSTLGTTYATSNTIDPQGMGYLVPNWLEIINLDESETRNFSYKIYNQQGEEVISGTVSVPPLAERDVQAGHELTDGNGNPTQGVYLAEVIPENGGKRYLQSISRYSSNSLPGVNPETYNYAFALNGKAGYTSTQYLPITNEDASSTCATVSNWVEIANISSTQATVTIEFWDQLGNSAGSDTLEIPAKAQYHYNASAMLSLGNVGRAVVSTQLLRSVISQSLVYYHNCDQNSLQTAYMVQARQIAPSTISGTVNTFLSMKDDMWLVSTDPSAVTASISVSSFDGSSGSSSISVNGNGLAVINLSEDTSYNVNDNVNGIATITTPSSSQVVGNIHRIRHYSADGRQRVDYVMPTLIR